MGVVSILPPLLVLVLGYWTRRIILSLICGIILAALIASDFQLLNSLKILSLYLIANSEIDKILNPSMFWETWNLFICIFLLVLGIYVVLLQHSGGVFAYGKFVQRFVKNKKDAETCSLALSHILFMDDYFSSLTVGSVMHPITDSHKIPRAKLAYLVDSMSAPLAILCPFSSWVAAVLGFLRENGISEHLTPNTSIIASPLITYFQIIPYLFYSFIIISSTWFVVRWRISFGLMKRYEHTATTSGNLFGGAKDPHRHKKNKDHSLETTALIDFIFPVLTLLFCVLIGMLYSGDWLGLGGERGFMSAMQNSKAAIALFLGGNLALFVCISFFIIRKKIQLSELPELFLEGIQLMAPAVIILLLAWTLGDVLRNQLHTGDYLASLISNSVPMVWLPTLFFFIATLIAFAIGSSWGTAAMLFPIAIPMVVSLQALPHIPTISEIPIIYPVLGAILSGCVAGDHISPISDTTIMSVTSTKSYLVDHVQSQLPIAMPFIIMTGFAFLIAGIAQEYSLLLATVVPILLVVVCGAFILKYFDSRSKVDLAQ